MHFKHFAQCYSHGQAPSVTHNDGADKQFRDLWRVKIIFHSERQGCASPHAFVASIFPAFLHRYAFVYHVACSVGLFYLDSHASFGGARHPLKNSHRDNPKNSNTPLEPDRSTHRNPPTHHRIPNRQQARLHQLQAYPRRCLQLSNHHRSHTRSRSRFLQPKPPLARPISSPNRICAKHLADLPIDFANSTTILSQNVHETS